MYRQLPNSKRAEISHSQQQVTCRQLRPSITVGLADLHVHIHVYVLPTKKDKLPLGQ